MRVVILALVCSVGCGSTDLEHSGVPTSVTVQGLYVYDADGRLLNLPVDQAIDRLLATAGERDLDFDLDEVQVVMVVGFPEIHVVFKVRCSSDDSTGCYDPNTRQIQVGSQLSDKATVFILLHELAHFLLDIQSKYGHPDLYFAVDGIVEQVYNEIEEK